MGSHEGSREEDRAPAGKGATRAMRGARRKAPCQAPRLTSGRPPLTRDIQGGRGGFWKASSGINPERAYRRFGAQVLVSQWEGEKKLEKIFLNNGKVLSTSAGPAAWPS